MSNYCLFIQCAVIKNHENLPKLANNKKNTKKKTNDELRTKEKNFTQENIEPEKENGT